MHSPDTSHPRFRRDLVAQPIETAGQRFVDVTDPDSGSTFRFYEVEYFMASAMDGTRDVAALGNWALAELGVRPAPSELEVVISTLQELGYLEASATVSYQDGLQQSGYLFPEYYEAEEDSRPAWRMFDQPLLELVAPGETPTKSLASLLGGSLPSQTPPESSEARVASALERPQLEPIELTQRERDLPGEVSSTSATDLDDDLEVPAATPSSPDEFFSIPAAANSIDDEFGAKTVVADFSVEEAFEATQERAAITERAPVTPQVSEFAYGEASKEEEVSVDLSAHVSVGSKDVKEAVRKSRATLSGPHQVTATSKEAPVSPPVSLVSKTSPVRKTSKKRRKRPAAVELPNSPKQITSKRGKSDVPDKARSRGIVAPILILLGILGVAALAYWYFTTGTTTGRATQPQSPIVVGKAVESSARPVAIVAMSTAIRSQQVAMPRAGEVSWMARDGALVGAGESVAHLKGYDSARLAIQHNEERKRVYQARLEKAEARLRTLRGPNSPLARTLRRSVRAIRRRIEEKTQNIAAAQKELEQTKVAAPVAGIAQRLATPGDLAAGTDLFKIVPPRGLVTTFSGLEPSTLHKGDTVAVHLARDPKTKLSCRVTNVIAETSAFVTCPAESGLRPGDKVVLSTVPTRATSALE